MSSLAATLVLTIAATGAIRIRSSHDIESALITGNSDFGHDLSAVLYDDEDTTKNIWISPFSITSCFALIYPGSVGSTASQIANIMRYPTESDKDDVTTSYLDLQSSIASMYDGSKISENEWDHSRHSIIGIANKIYSAKGLPLKQSFVAFVDVLNHGDESFIEYDFDFTADDAASTINDWVDENTNGLIEEVVGEGDDISDWKLAALNAIYLNATFKLQFAEYMTSKQPFYDSLARTNALADCHLMHQMDYFEYFNDGNYQFLKFPLGTKDSEENLFILFAVPLNHDVYSTKNGLITDVNVIHDAISKLESTYIALAVPKLSIEAQYQLKDPLTKMGMTRAFSDSADFSGISTESLKIDAVIHKTMVDMDEKGIVAAAVTMIGMVGMSMPVTTKPQPILFKADHSFQMFIIDGDHENTVLFMGQINNPGIPEGAETPSYDESEDPVWTQYVESDTVTEGPVIYVASGDTIHSNRHPMAVYSGIVVLVLAALVVTYGVIRTRAAKAQTKDFESLKDEEDDDDEFDQFGSSPSNEKSDMTMKRLDSSERALIDSDP